MSSFLEKLEAKTRVEADFKSTLRNALMTVFLAVSGCGTEKEKPDNTDPAENPTSVSPGGGGSGPNNSDRYQIGGPALTDQLKGRGWGCRIVLVDSRTMHWEFYFNIERMTGKRAYKNQPKFYLTFTRDNKDSPWNMDEPEIEDDSILDFDPAIQTLEELKKNVKEGYKYVYDKYGCELGKINSQDMY